MAPAMLLRAGLVAWTIFAGTVAPAAVGRAWATLSPGEPARGGAASEQDDRQAEIDRFKTAGISLRAALSIAERRHRGSRAVDASFDGETGVASYRIRTHRGRRLWLDIIDARTGHVAAPGAVSPLTELRLSDRDVLARMRSVRQGLADAIVVAERNTGGKAVSAGLMIEQGRLQFAIVCVAGNDLKQVLLEPPTARARTRP
jgi:uncharacterized membrane protein YkoI